MAKQVLVIGLGRFGMAVAESLTQRGADVLGADSRNDRVRAAAAILAQAACFDATDAEALGRTLPAQRDACVVAIGDDSKESSILVTALLRQMGATRIIARANQELHSRILQLVGAHEIVNPVQEVGARLASRLVFDRLIGEMPLGEDLVISEIQPPPAFVGKTLIDLKLPQRFKVTVVAIRQGRERKVSLPRPDYRLEAGDILVLVSRAGAVAKLAEEA